VGQDAIVSGDTSGVLRVWDRFTGRERQQLVGHTDAVNAIAAVADGPRVATAGDDQTVRVWDTGSGRQLLKIPDLAGIPTDLAVSPDGGRVAVAVRYSEAKAGAPTGEVIIVDADTGVTVLTLTLPGSRACAVAFSPQGDRLATACADGRVRLWAPIDGRLMAEWLGHQGRVLTVAFSPDGRKVASGGDDGLAILWEVATGRPVHHFRGHSRQINAVSFRSDGRLLATAGYDGEVREWDVHSGEEIARHATSRGSVNCVIYSPDGKNIIIGSGDSVIRVRPTACESRVAGRTSVESVR
jgi:DNA-binding beta-propeller fold protein YncE